MTDMTEAPSAFFHFSDAVVFTLHVITCMDIAQCCIPLEWKVQNIPSFTVVYIL